MATAADPQGGAYVRLPTPEAMAAGRPGDHPYNFGFATGMGRLLMAHPRIGPAFQAMYAEIMFAPGALDRGEREMVAGVTAAAQFCHY
jgi:alkylhydroperoxidase/carboxymuconolactone decarboxylase family protein YurZ